MKKLKLALFCLLIALALHSQTDSIASSKSLDSVVVVSYLNQNVLRPLAAVSGTCIFSGKKTEVTELGQIPADITNKTGRQPYAKVPRILLYDYLNICFPKNN